MQFIKKVLVLKQIGEGYAIANKTVSGIYRLEIENGVPSVFLSLVNFRATNTGEYYLVFCENKTDVFLYPLTNRPSSFNKTLECALSLNCGLAVGIAFIDNDVPFLICFGRTDDCEISITDFRRIITDKCIEIREKRQSVIREEAERKQVETKPLQAQTSVTDTYNDEAVATENYFDLDEDLQNKLNRIRDFDYELSNENDATYDCDAKKPQENQNTPDGNKDARTVSESQKHTENTPYYLTVQNELNDIFQKFPEETSLMKTFPDSKWARINYSAEKYYVVGLIKENKKEKYICYGIPSPYSETPPKELKGYCSFIPISVFEMKGDGYFVMFQSAITGECIHK